MEEQNKPLVMYVDDDQVTLDLMTVYLQSQGVNIVKATTGAEALRLLATLDKQVQLIFLDVAMPGMSGYELAKTIRQQPGNANLQIIAVTARVAPEVEVLAAEAGINAVVSKPFAPKELRAILVSAGILTSSPS